MRQLLRTLVPFVLAQYFGSAVLEAELTLVDHSIASWNSPIYLDDDQWLLKSPHDGRVLPGTIVPGDIITDLQKHGLAQDPYWNVTWRDPKFIAAWNEGVWHYMYDFETPDCFSSRGGCLSALLVFDGIRMGAMISLNGKPLGNASNQFQRYIFEVSKQDLRTSDKNRVDIAFGAELGIDCGGRYTYSSQIDWAPDMLTKDRFDKRSTFGFGIWKSVYMVPLTAGEAAITQLAPHTFYAGGHPTSILSDDNHKGFDVSVGVEFFSTGEVSGVLSVYGMWPGHPVVEKNVTLTKGINDVSVSIVAAQTTGVRLWHPHGHGAQPRYDITAKFVPTQYKSKVAIFFDVQPILKSTLRVEHLAENLSPVEDETLFI